jgi:hypothetical protein
MPKKTTVSPEAKPDEAMERVLKYHYAVNCERNGDEASMEWKDYKSMMTSKYQNKDGNYKNPDALKAEDKDIQRQLLKMQKKLSTRDLKKKSSTEILR